MSGSSISRMRMYGKALNALIVEAVIILSFFVLAYAGMDFFHGATSVLLLLYPLGISITTGFVIAFIAETKHLTRWKWGALATVATLILMIMMLFFPSSLSGMAFVIAPAISLILLPAIMDSEEKNQ